MEKPLIAPATSEERDWTAGLLARSEPWTRLGISAQECREACRNPEYLVYVAHIYGQPCGAMVLHRCGVAGAPYVKSFIVAYEFRGHGVGAEMMAFAEDLFRPEARHLFLCVSSFNTKARAFYERLGFRAVGEFQDYVIEGASEILMHKRLR